MNVARIILRIERKTAGPPEDTVRRNWGRPEMPSLDYLTDLVEDAYTTIDAEWWVSRIQLDVYDRVDGEPTFSALAVDRLDDPREVAKTLWEGLAPVTETERE